MLDGTYKINNFSMPLYTMAVVDQNGMGRPVVQSLVYREDQSHLQLLMTHAKEWAVIETFQKLMFMVDKAQAEISGLQSVFPGNKIFLCRFHVAKAFIYQIKKGRLTADDQELLFKATQKLMYGNQATCAEALLNIEKNFPTFYVYLQENWLTIPEMLMGHYRKGLMHLDNHTNNRLERYHRTLKDVGLLSRMSPGNLIDKILKVNRVQIEKSKHADFDQQLKINNKLSEPLKFYSRHVSSFILRHLMEQYDKSVKSDFSLYEDRDSLQIIDRQSTFYNIID
nr:uncharacterized protein LOC105844566 [Hydra vulgaris]